MTQLEAPGFPGRYLLIHGGTVTLRVYYYQAGWQTVAIRDIPDGMKNEEVAQWCHYSWIFPREYARFIQALAEGRA